MKTSTQNGRRPYSTIPVGYDLFSICLDRVTKINAALYVYLVEKLKRSGAYRETKKQIEQEFPNTGLRIEYVRPEETIGRKDIRLLLERLGRRPITTRLASSSGTSGAPILFPQPIAALQAEQAYIDSFWETLDFSPNCRLLTMRGTGGYSGTHRFLNRMVISCDGWSDDDLRRKYLAFIAFSPEFIHCYPSILARFVLRCLSMGLNKFSEVRGVLSGSESCLGQHIDLFKEVFNAATVSWYGQSEQVALGYQVSNQEYHLLHEYSQIAFIQRDDHEFEIVGKSMLNPFFSKNWYRTGDFCESPRVVYSETLRRKVISVMNLRGREPQYIVSKDGIVTPFNHLLFGFHDASWFAVSHYFFLHEKPGVLKFYFARADNRDVRPLLIGLSQRIPEGFEFLPIEYPDLRLLNDPKWTYLYTDAPFFLKTHGI